MHADWMNRGWITALEADRQDKLIPNDWTICDRCDCFIAPWYLEAHTALHGVADATDAAAEVMRDTLTEEDRGELQMHADWMNHISLYDGNGYNSQENLIMKAERGKGITHVDWDAIARLKDAFESGEGKDISTSVAALIWYTRNAP